MFNFLFSRSRKKAKALSRDTRGVSLIVVMGLMFVLLLLMGVVIKLVVSFMKTTKQSEEANAAYFAAEAGVETALYDLAAYQDGYETDPNKNICGNDVDLSLVTNFTEQCSDSNNYRFVNFTNEGLSKGRGFWRLFSQTLKSYGSISYEIPNPYFFGDKNGQLESLNDDGENEWGLLTKSQPVSFSLLIDGGDLTETDPAVRFSYFSNGADKKVIFDPGVWDTSANSSSDDQELLVWTLSAIDDSGEEYTLQGVVWESDFIDDCSNFDGAGTDCFVLDLDDKTATIDALVGEDINDNLNITSGTRFNRVSGITEEFSYATPADFIEKMEDKMVNVGVHSMRLTVSLIATLAETSDVESNVLHYKLISKEPWADEYTYIIAEGFSGRVKQTIETRFRKGATIPIFSYVIFQ